MKSQLNTVEEAIEDIRNGKIVIVVDDEDRENEGDFICAAELATPEIVNFMATYGRGLICVPLPEDRCEELELDLMVPVNTSLHATPFTVSVDLLGHGCSTGISAGDRAKTIKALIDPDTGIELGRDSSKVADVSVFAVEEKFSKAKVVGTAQGEIEKGDVVKQ